MQRDYFSDAKTSCAEVSDTAVTILAGPLNYVGVNPKVKCKGAEPSRRHDPAAERIYSP